jgi:hypothetical protein
MTRMHAWSLPFGWPLFRKPLLWGTTAWFISMVAFGVAVGALIALPDKWDRAIALKVCGGMPVVQLEDGSIWLRHRWRAYRVENLDKLC